MTLVVVVLLSSEEEKAGCVPNFTSVHCFVYTEPIVQSLETGEPLCRLPAHTARLTDHHDPRSCFTGSHKCARAAGELQGEDGLLFPNTSQAEYEAVALTDRAGH